MLTVMFLLALVYVAFIAALITLLKSVVVVVVIAAGVLAAQYGFSGRIGLFAMHAREVSPQGRPQLHGTVDRLCALANMAKARVAVSGKDLPHAFATGRARPPSTSHRRPGRAPAVTQEAEPRNLGLSRRRHAE
jgi:heat shock protein HtpX